MCMQSFERKHVWQQRKVVVIVGLVDSQWIIVQSQPPAHVERPFRTTSNSSANTKAEWSKATKAMCKSNATNTSQLRQTKQIHTQQQRQPLAEADGNTSRTKMGSTSRNNEEHKENTHAETMRNPSRNKEKHKPKQGETHAKIEGSTSRNRGTH